MLHLLHCITNEEKYKKLLCNESKSLPKAWKASGKHTCVILSQIDTLHCQWKNWNTREDNGKSMIHVLYVMQLVKRHISGQSNVEIKPIALFFIELLLAEDTVSYSRREFWHFTNFLEGIWWHFKNFLEGIWRHFLGLALHNQYCQTVVIKFEADILGRKSRFLLTYFMVNLVLKPRKFFQAARYKN